MSARFPSSKFVADGTVNGSLYDLGEYPGLLLDGSNTSVIGEVYEVDDETLNELDEFEASSNYRRKQVEVSLGSEKTTCSMYVPEDSSEVSSSRPLIPSGDWMEYARTQSDWPEDTCSDVTQD